MNLLNVFIAVTNVSIIALILIFGKRTTDYTEKKINNYSEIFNKELLFIKDFQKENFKELNSKLSKFIDINIKNQKNITDKIDQLTINISKLDRMVQRHEEQLIKIKNYVGLDNV